MKGSISCARILPGLISQYTIVALPTWAWIWIDDHVRTTYANDYGSFIKDAGEILKCDSELPSFLSLIATDLRDHKMRNLYNLANDNDILLDFKNNKKRKQRSKRYPRSFSFPTIFMVFKFMPHATDMKTLWHRRNYHKYS
ncbi:MAG: hypothetical protein AAF569_02545 [Pseudomonadota bacterium]